ncbi:Fic family protein [Bacteroides oleiciplenus]|uniref:DeoR family transcriptional regulator n=1 Tax=Bacteroides oleiciplenus TaxID=626931 RepID=A0A3E5BAH4_9BACE|nr:Fic family protein [Bacteroides oleiciplenus]RGN34355.1 DeoR family transcriptional regulator [Bacteroides oleiciplenus]
MNRELKILSLLAQFKELGIDKQIDYDKFYLYSIITHSTAIEGSTVTEVENQLLFDEGISAKGRSMAEQLMNLDLKAAYEQSIVFAKNHSDISINMLKQLSSIVLKNTGTTYQTALGEFSSANGDLRLLNVTAGTGGRSYMNYSKVPIRLAELCESINQRRKALIKEDIIECYKLSFDAHFQLVTIHPWADGNGRMTRLLMNQLQLEFGIIPTNINKNHKAEYIESLIATRENDDIGLFRNFMFDEHIRNLEQMIHNYQSSIDDDIKVDKDVRVNVHQNVRVKPTSRENRIIELMAENENITVHQLANALNVNERTIRRDITNLKERGVLTRIGADKNGIWKITGRQN